MTTRTRLTRRLMSLLALAPVCFLGTMVATAARAGENYALIVAASDYPNLDQKYWLKGPKNDEALIRDYLLNSAPVKFAPQNVVALGTGDGLQLGTHQAILDNMARIAETAKPGDFVYLHFSGHGTQQPAIDDTTEPDGRDEVFLPADTRMAPPDNPKPSRQPGTTVASTATIAMPAKNGTVCACEPRRRTWCSSGIRSDAAM